MKTASLPLLLFSLCAAGTAHAGVRVEVDPGAPFTEADLADAVDIRTPADAGGDEVVIRVAKLGMDQLVIIVGDRSQVVKLTDHDRTASSRVVALVVTAMLDDGSETPVAARPVVAELAPPRPPLARTSFHAGLATTRDDNGYIIPFVNLGAARVISPNARLVGTLGFARFDGYLDTSSVLVPLRVGFEGHAGAAAIEIGGEMVSYRESSCGAAEWGHATGVYGAGKIYLPMGARSRAFTELGGHYVGSVSPTMCNSASNYTSYGGWLGVGVEWGN